MPLMQVNIILITGVNLFLMSSITGNWGLYGICNLCKEEMTIPTASL